MQLAKSLIIAEDIETGIGKISQTRSSGDIEVTKLNATHLGGTVVVNTLEELNNIDVANLGDTKLVRVIETKTDYLYNNETTIWDIFSMNSGSFNSLYNKNISLSSNTTSILTIGSFKGSFVIEYIKISSTSGLAKLDVSIKLNDEDIFILKYMEGDIYVRPSEFIYTLESTELKLSIYNSDTTDNASEDLDINISIIEL